MSQENHGAGVRVCETRGCGYVSACWPVEVFGPGQPVKASEAVMRRRCPKCLKLQGGPLPAGYVGLRGEAWSGVAKVSAVTVVFVVSWAVAIGAAALVWWLLGPEK